MASKLLKNGRPRIRLLDVVRFAYDNYPHTAVAIIYAALELYKEKRKGHRIAPTHDPMDNLRNFYNALCIDKETYE